MRLLSRERVSAALDPESCRVVQSRILRIDNAYLEVSRPTIPRSEARRGRLVREDFHFRFSIEVSQALIFIFGTFVFRAISECKLPFFLTISFGRWKSQMSFEKWIFFAIVRETWLNKLLLFSTNSSSSFHEAVFMAHYPIERIDALLVLEYSS